MVHADPQQKGGVMEQKKEPVYRVTRGRIVVPIWENETNDGGVWFNTKPLRLYRDGDKWKQADTFRRDDLPILALAVETAYRWIWRETERRESAQKGMPKSNGRQSSRRA